MSELYYKWITYSQGMWRKRKETKLLLANSTLAYIIRLKSKDTLHKHCALIKNMQGMGQPT